MSSLAFRFCTLIGSLTVIGIILWIDLTTSIWQDYAVISGLAGGLVTFLLTALVVDRVVARSTHERWAPVTRIALGDLRRMLTADIPEVTTGMRRLPTPETAQSSLADLREAASDERDRVAAVLGRWSSFLAASADVVDVMDAIAELAEKLDVIDVLATSTQHGSTESDITQLRAEIDDYHAACQNLIRRIDDALDTYKFSRRRRTSVRP